jgi:hypothetical protein
LHFSYPDPVSAKVEEEYYGSGLKLPKGFTGFMSRRERLQNERGIDGVLSIIAPDQKD